MSVLEENKYERDLPPDRPMRGEDFGIYEEMTHKEQMLEYALKSQAREYEKHNIMNSGFEQLDKALTEASHDKYNGFEQLQNSMADAVLRSGYDEQKLRIAQLESWVAEVISRPWMPTELRMEGLELVGAERPDLRQAVERICPRRTVEHGLEQSLEL
jgi:hypothetical protein